MFRLQNTPASASQFPIFSEIESAVRSYSRTFPAVFTRACGARLFDREGRVYLDFLTGCSSLNYGHNPPALKQALLEYITNDGIAHSLDLYSDAKERFLEELSETILKPRGLDYVVQFPGPTGANAIEAALKLARKVTGRHNVIAFTNGFHGATLGALSCTGNRLHRGGAGLPLSDVTRHPYDGYLGPLVDTADYLDRVLSDPSSGVDPPAAIIVEAVQGEGGLNSASYDWLRALAAIAVRHGALLVLDDIQAGVGRTGPFFSFEPAAIEPDIVTLAKSISGYGLPMALVLIKRPFDEWAPGEHNGTFRGNCHAFVTARVALEHFWRSAALENAIASNGRLLEKHLRHIAEKHVAAQLLIKGRGMMRGLDMGSGAVARQVIQAAFRKGLIIETSGPRSEVIKCLPPLVASEEELVEGLCILEAAIDAVMSSKSDIVAKGSSNDHQRSR